MEKKMEEMVMKKENSNSSTTTTYYDMFEGGGGGGGCDQRETLGSLGFMDLLGVQDFGSSIFDFLQQVPPLGPPAPQPLEQSQPLVAPPQPPVKETSEVLNLPATPNSSSISSSSNEVTIDKVVEEEVQDKSKKQLKPKKKNQKRQREPRFAFMTKSDVDHLEDGYRWRKYGQKAVKNSPFPRSYYRCTNTTCGVKKRVERSCDDPTVVVTTYEGQHTHQSPVVPRSSSGGIPRDPASFGVAASGYTMPTQLAQTHYHHYQQQQQPQQQQQQSYFHGLSPPLNFNSTTTTTATTTTSSPMFSSRASMLRDHGLLEDLVPSDFR